MRKKTKQNTKGGRETSDPSYEEEQARPFCGRDFFFDISSAFFFLLGSILYLLLGTIYVDYEKEIEGIPWEILDSDDWYFYNWTEINNYTDYDDDYLIQNEDEDLYISYYQVVYFFAALCFIITGVLECFNRGDGCVRSILPIIYILAGSSGMCSAFFVEANNYLSAIFNSISVHLFLLEGIGLVARHITAMRRSLRILLWVGDVFFVVGSAMDVALSYYWVAGDLNLEKAKLWVVSASFWIICALIYGSATIWTEFDLRKKLLDENQNDYKAGQEAPEEAALFHLMKTFKTQNHTEDLRELSIEESSIHSA